MSMRLWGTAVALLLVLRTLRVAMVPTKATARHTQSTAATTIVAMNHALERNESDLRGMETNNSLGICRNQRTVLRRLRLSWIKGEVGM